jgi:hypothetical protein
MEPQINADKIKCESSHRYTQINTDKIELQSPLAPHPSSLKNRRRWTPITTKEKIDRINRIYRFRKETIPLLPEGEPGFRRTCLRTFEPANARLDAARRAGRGGCEADGVVGGHPSALSDT